MLDIFRSQNITISMITLEVKLNFGALVVFYRKGAFSLKIKQQGWFAAGPEVRNALLILSDGGFRLYFHLCLNASRATGRSQVKYAELARDLARSRRSIASYFDELRDKRVCVATCAKNQHSRTEVEICDEFWPYSKERGADTLSAWHSYRESIRALLSKRACIKCSFSGADERFAQELFERKVTLMEIEQALALACCRKYVGLLNGTDNDIIRRFCYFRDTIDEVLDPEAHTSQAALLNQRMLSVEYYEEKWLAKHGRCADAEFAPAARSKVRQTG